MESPLQEQCNCPACLSQRYHCSDNLHLLSSKCLEMENAIAGLERRTACPCCRDIPRVYCQQLADFCRQTLLALFLNASDEEKREGQSAALCMHWCDDVT
ncbi:hypothetical protein D9C73_012765 [Collichthys lucidus]|uniref:Uncharacterized protein n=1 Tax=Collichthys lucidus TaxID=240159 RepID=A0A4U5UTW4_COLLU|nr:hypothetical protein D9C73_012765 [Collichthys lucidus]